MLVGNLIQREFLQVRNWETGSSISLIMIFIIFVSLMIFRIFVKKSDNEFRLKWPRRSGALRGRARTRRPGRESLDFRLSVVGLKLLDGWPF